MTTATSIFFPIFSPQNLSFDLKIFPNFIRKSTPKFVYILIDSQEKEGGKYPISTEILSEFE